jgi:hypothetical protein
MTLMENQHPPDLLPAGLTRLAYERLMRRAHDLAEQALRCLEELRGLYPSDLSEEVIVAVRRFSERLSDERPAPGGQERRRAPRFPAVGKLTLADPQAPGQPWEAVTVDRSWGGFSFRADRAFALGSVVTVADTADPGSGPQRRAEVKSCRPKGEAWVVGCELLPAPEPGGGA